MWWIIGFLALGAFVLMGWSWLKSGTINDQMMTEAVLKRKCEEGMSYLDAVEYIRDSYAKGELNETQASRLLGSLQRWLRRGVIPMK